MARTGEAGEVEGNETYDLIEHGERSYAGAEVETGNFCYSSPHKVRTSLVAQMVKNLPAGQEIRFDPWVRKIPLRRAWQLTPIFLPGELHGQRNLAGCIPWGCKELDRTE